MRRFVPPVLFLPLLVSLVLAPCAPARAGDPPPELPQLLVRLLPQVVNISVETLVKPPPATMAKSASTAAYTRKRSLGSGFIIDPSGIIVTNNHVINNADEITVILHNNTRLRARLVFKAPIDMALLKVTYDKKLPAVTWGDSDSVRPGDKVFAIGNPLGLGSSVSAGIVSALDRDIQETPYDSFIQTDAAINHGNSGGPLFNAAGEVIGINTALFAPDDAANSGSIGLGLAIPSNDAQFMLNTLKEYGRIRTGWLGAGVQELTQDMADALQMPQNWGVIVTKVPPKTAAAKSGLREGDVIVTVADKEMYNLRALNRTVAGSPLGEEVPMVVWRENKMVTLSLPIQEPPVDTSKPPPMPMKMPPPHVVRPDSGLALATLTDDLRRKYGIARTQKGVVVTAVVPNSAAADRGIVPGDVIVKVQQQPVSTPDDVKKFVDWAWNTKHPHILLLFQDEKNARYVALPVGSGVATDAGPG